MLTDRTCDLRNYIHPPTQTEHYTIAGRAASPLASVRTHIMQSSVRSSSMPATIKEIAKVAAPETRHVFDLRVVNGVVEEPGEHELLLASRIHQLHTYMSGSGSQRM